MNWEIYAGRGLDEIELGMSYSKFTSKFPSPSSSRTFHSKIEDLWETFLIPPVTVCFQDSKIVRIFVEVESFKHFLIDGTELSADSIHRWAQSTSIVPHVSNALEVKTEDYVELGIQLSYGFEGNLEVVALTNPRVCSQ